jgi:phosphoribosyl-AMP cyclohydrolase
LILFVHVAGPGSCHVGFRSCFDREVYLPAFDHSRLRRLRRIEPQPAFYANSVYAGLPNSTTL